jgi:hypothetical protein
MTKLVLMMTLSTLGGVGVVVGNFAMVKKPTPEAIFTYLFIQFVS